MGEKNANMCTGAIYLLARLKFCDQSGAENATIATNRSLSWVTQFLEDKDESVRKAAVLAIGIMVDKRNQGKLSESGVCILLSGLVKNETIWNTVQQDTTKWGHGSQEERAARE